MEESRGKAFPPREGGWKRCQGRSTQRVQRRARGSCGWSRVSEGVAVLGEGRDATGSGHMRLEDHCKEFGY